MIIIKKTNTFVPSICIFIKQTKYLNLIFISYTFFTYTNLIHISSCQNHMSELQIFLRLFGHHVDKITVLSLNYTLSNNLHITLDWRGWAGIQQK